MSNKILIKRGLKSSMPTLDIGELGLATDTSEMFIGTTNGNKLVNSSGGGGGLTPEQEAKLDLIKSSGDGTKYLADDGVYKVVSGGGSGVDLDTLPYMNYAANIYYQGGSQTLFSSAWQDMKDSETVLFDIPLALAAPNQEMGGMTIDLYVGTNEQLQELYDACANGTIPPPISSDNRDVYYVNDVATFYAGDVSGDVDFPIPLYSFGSFDADDNTSFLVGDLTPLGMGLGLVLAKIVNVSIPNNNIVIKQGFEFENESGIIIPNSVTSIGEYAFYRWESNNQPLVIGNSVTSIGEYAFYRWESNKHPLVIPDSVTSIGGSVFSYWKSNNQPLVIPNSVTHISDNAFRNWSSNNQPLVIPNSVTGIYSGAFYGWSLVPYVEIQAITPPQLTSASAFDSQNNAPIYVPNGSVDDYKNATNWSALASRIFSINEK